MTDSSTFAPDWISPPGDTIEDLLAERGWSKAEFAERTGFTAKHVNELVKGREGLQSPIVKNIHDTALNAVLERTGAQDGDLIFFGADKAKIVNDAIGALRIKIGHSEFGKKNGLFEKAWRPMWVVDFPMFEFDEEAQRYTATHHPFTAPKDGHEDWMVTAPEKCISKGYDMVLNGWEMGGGSVRIHRADVQQKVFDALKISPEEAQLKFGFLLDASSTISFKFLAIRWGAYFICQNANVRCKGDIKKSSKRHHR